jgi:hypothetical protein
MLRPLLIRSVVALLLAFGVAALFLHRSACVAQERPLARIPMEGLINPELGPGLPSAEEIEVSKPLGRPVLTR